MAKSNDQNYNDLIEDEQFLQWFWFRRNGNKLIQFLNKHTQEGRDDKLRRERYSPSVYGLVLNDVVYSGTSSKRNAFNKKFRLMKIGYSELTDNRTKKIKKKFDNLGEQISTIFVLKKNAVDTSWGHHFEKRIRNNFGIPIRTEYDTYLRLEEPTEWVLTRTGCIKKFKKYQKELKELGSVDASILKIDSFERFKLRHRDERIFSVIIKEIC